VWGGHGEHAHKTPSNDTKMLLKVVFNKTALVKFSNNSKQNIDQTIPNHKKSKGKIHTSL
jgi:hypothetical protein